MIRLSEEEAKKLFGVSGDPEIKPKKKSVVRGKKKNKGNGGERQVALERAGIKVDSSKGAKV